MLINIHTVEVGSRKVIDQNEAFSAYEPQWPCALAGQNQNGRYT